MPGHRPASARHCRGRGPAAPKARHGFDDNAGTSAPASAPAASNWPAAGRPAAAMPGLLPGIPGDDRPAGHLGGQEHPFGEGRASRPAGAPGARTTSRERVAGAGLVYRGDGAWPWPRPGSYFAGRRHQPATGYGPGRAGQIGGPAGRSPCRRWHRIRAGLRIAESRPPGRLWVREPPRAILVPVVRMLFPAPGRGLACPGSGPGKAVRAVR